MTRTLSDSEQIQRRYAAWKHGARSEFARTGDEALLDEDDRSRLQAIRAELLTPGGCRRALEAHTAALGQLADMGFELLRERAEREGGAAAFAAAITPNVVRAMSIYRQAIEALGHMTGGQR